MGFSSAGIQALLFAFFAAITAGIAAVIGPTYDNLLVPELATSALYPTLTATGGGGFLASAVPFSNTLLLDLVDPAIGLVALAVGLLYLLRAVSTSLGQRLSGLLPRLVAGILVANLTVPIAGALLALGGATYPIVAGLDGGAWQSWTNLGGLGLLRFSWDNGLLAFILSFVLLSLILLLAVAVAVRDALLAVLLVLLPALTLLYPIPRVGELARRGWLWFVELTFLPCAVVVPLELAVGAPSILLLIAYLSVALGAPAILSIAGRSLQGVGWPSPAGAITGGIERGLLAASSSLQGFLRPAMPLLAGSKVAGPLASAGARSLGRSLPLALPAFSSEMLGHGAARLLRHVAAPGARPATPAAGASARWHAPAVRSGAEE